MIELIIVVLVVLWALGFFALHLGSIVHILLVLFVIAVIFRLIKGSNRSL